MIAQGTPGVASSLLVSVVVPFYNEEACVEQTCTDLRATLQQAGLQFEIVAVQNGSWDKTGELLKGLASRYREFRLVDVPVNKGFGYGVLQGLLACTGDIVGWMPGDGQIPSISVAQVLAEMRRTGAPVGKTRRINRRDDWTRRLFSAVLNRFARLMLGISTSDVDGTPKLLQRAAYEALRLRSYDSFLDMEVLVKAKRLGLRICEIDVPSLARIGGRSKVRWLETSTEFVRNVLRAKFLKHDPWGIHALDSLRKV